MPGRCTHDLADTRATAETIDGRLGVAWPRRTAFERQAFADLCRAYVGARYGRSFAVALPAVTWMMERTRILQMIVKTICGERLGWPGKDAGAVGEGVRS